MNKQQLAFARDMARVIILGAVIMVALLILALWVQFVLPAWAWVMVTVARWMAGVS